MKNKEYKMKKNISTKKNKDEKINMEEEKLQQEPAEELQ